MAQSLPRRSPPPQRRLPESRRAFLRASQFVQSKERRLSSARSFALRRGILGRMSIKPSHLLAGAAAAGLGLGLYFLTRQKVQAVATTPEEKAKTSSLAAANFAVAPAGEPLPAFAASSKRPFYYLGSTWDKLLAAMEGMQYVPSYDLGYATSWLGFRQGTDLSKLTPIGYDAVRQAARSANEHLIIRKTDAEKLLSGQDPGLFTIFQASNASEDVLAKDMASSNNSIIELVWAPRDAS